MCLSWNYDWNSHTKGARNYYYYCMVLNLTLCKDHEIASLMFGENIPDDMYLPSAICYGGEGKMFTHLLPTPSTAPQLSVFWVFARYWIIKLINHEFPNTCSQVHKKILELRSSYVQSSKVNSWYYGFTVHPKLSENFMYPNYKVQPMNFLLTLWIAPLQVLPMSTYSCKFQTCKFELHPQVC